MHRALFTDPASATGFPSSLKSFTRFNLDIPTDLPCQYMGDGNSFIPPPPPMPPPISKSKESQVGYCLLILNLLIGHL